MPDGLPRNESLALDLKQRIDRICDRFEAAWKSPERPQIESYIARSGGRPRTELLRELLAIELEYRARLGEQPSIEEYDLRFPGDVAVIREAFEKASVRKPAASTESAVETIDWSGTLDAQVPARRAPAAGAAGPTLDATAAPKSPVPASAANKTFGRFKIIKLLGRGAFGSVYQAHDPQLDRYAALKIPHAGTIDSDDDAQRFLREARAAGQLRHPYIVPVFDAGQVGNTYYIASAYIEGTALRYAIRDGRFGKHREAVAMLMKLAAALNYAHEQGIVHRDIKPENILVDAAGNPYVLDFGLARRNDAQVLATLDGAVMGTPVYMSPEQAGGKSHLADGRSDLWSLGVILYELLCDARPFAGAGHELYTAILEQQPIAPRKRNTAIPGDLETITLKCLAKEPDQRYPTCAEFGDDLQRWLGDEPIQARRSGLGERAWRWSKKNPALATAAMVIGLLAVVSTFSAIGLQRSRAESEAHASRAQAALDKLNEEAERRQQLEAALQVRAAEIVEKETELKATEQLVRARELDLRDRNAKLAERDSLLKQRDDTLATVTADLNSVKALAEQQKKEAVTAKNEGGPDKETSFKLYQERMQQAIKEQGEGQSDRALATLETCPKEWRGWEWEYFSKIAAGNSVRWKHDEPERDVNAPPQGLVAPTIRPLAFDPQGLRLLAETNRHFYNRGNPNPTFLCVYGGRGEQTFSCEFLASMRNRPTFSATGDLMAFPTVGKNIVCLGGTHAPRLVHPLKDLGVQAACLSPDGKALACISQVRGKRMRLTISDTTAAAGTLLGQKDFDAEQYSFIGGLFSLAYSPNGAYLLATGAGRWQGMLIKCDVDEDPAYWTDLSALPDTRTTVLQIGGLHNHSFTLLVNDVGGITELSTGRVIREGNEKIGLPIAFSADDRRLLCVSREHTAMTVVDTTEAAQGILRQLVTMSVSEFCDLSGFDDRTLYNGLVVSSQLNSFALRWYDKANNGFHLRVWGPY